MDLNNKMLTIPSAASGISRALALALAATINACFTAWPGRANAAWWRLGYLGTGIL